MSILSWGGGGLSNYSLRDSRNKRCNRAICKTCFPEHKKHNTVVPEEHAKLMKIHQQEEEEVVKKVGYLFEEFDGLKQICESKKEDAVAKFNEVLRRIDQVKDEVNKRKKATEEKIQATLEVIMERRKVETFWGSRSKPKAKKVIAAFSLEDTSAKLNMIRENVNQISTASLEMDLDQLWKSTHSTNAASLKGKSSKGGLH